MGIGGSILFDPHTFFANNGIALGNNPNLLSEIRAPGGLLLAAGLVMLSGAIKRSIMRAAQITTIVVFGMYGGSRLLSIVLDGAPSGSLIGAMVLELFIAALAMLLFAQTTIPASTKSKGCNNAS